MEGTGKVCRVGNGATFATSLCHHAGMEEACHRVVGSEQRGLWFPGLASGGKRCELVGQDRHGGLQAEL